MAESTLSRSAVALTVATGVTSAGLLVASKPFAVRDYAINLILVLACAFVGAVFVCHMGGSRNGALAIHLVLAAIGLFILGFSQPQNATPYGLTGLVLGCVASFRLAISSGKLERSERCRDDIDSGDRAKNF